MCWSTPVSVFLILLGFVVAAYSPRGWIRGEVLFVLLMEVLQLMGIFVADRCEHPLNPIITYLSLIHISLQPWTYQEWQWEIAELRGFRFSDDHKRLVRGLAAAFAIGFWMRMIPCQSEPCYYCAEREHFCQSDGSIACTRMGAYHVYWRAPLRPVNALWPGLWGHFALTILPGIINGGTYERIQTLLLFTTGAAASFYVAKLGNPETAFDEGPSLWCIVAIPQHLVTWLVVLKYRESNPPGGKYKPAGIDLVSVDDYRTTTAPVKLRRRQRL